jgi:diguanylate cyclase (GGDEF)-like protein
VALERSRRAGGALCVAMLDLDHFKIFNDEHGHQTGDLLLQTTVRIWRNALRSSDLIARHGGEEFAVLFTGCPLERAAELVDGLRRIVPRGLTCSAGVAEWDGRETSESLMLRADAALYEAKRQGRDRSVLAPARGADVHSPAPATLWSSIALDLLRDGHVGAVYQPVVRLKDRTVIGYEALARPPGTEGIGSVEGLFVAAQRMGLTREIDYLCRRGALEGARALPPALPLFVNVSVAALLDPEHDPDQMLFLVRLTGRRPHNVILEISERESITDPLRFGAAVRAYREHGFRFAIDDVGAGHSTFETLAAVTPEYVKLAGHFVRRVGEPGPRAAMIAACSYADASGASVIAEGIEDEATVIALRDLNIDLGQGYHLGRPAPVEASDDLIASPLPAALGGWT